MDESHKIPEVAREMFGVALCKEDLKAIIYDLRAARYILAAEYLADAAKPLLACFALLPENESFSTYVERLRIPYRVLQTIEQKLCSQLTHLLRRNLQKVTMTIRTLLQYESEENIICFAGGDENGGTKLCATVYDLAGPIKKIIWSKSQSMILTSGTLAVGNDFSRFREETGLVHHGGGVESISESPYPYKENTLLYLPKYPLVQFVDKVSYYYDALGRGNLSAH